ncbi:HNH endonuclease signature motif containing protein [Devosia sp. J2-20]|uniref:HNH endonuclease signature motif containing protein n=1 Tax=Devosia sp. J2-20 TaxID=3026161 RepID=UPI00249B291E|nr:HNH endonuclease signature motif containing protein [Devosia sp. J2-20]WDR00930.1 HNH endonuclease signature motif containing protein [Devosia sp. J2-20]
MLTLAGFCQNPDCTTQLFFESNDGESRHIAEMAHIIAANDKGPRADANVTPADRGAYDNLILLCANCHTKIDKAPDDFPDETIRAWKNDRAEALQRLFGVPLLQQRCEVLSFISPIMEENKVVLDTYGPGSDAKFDPESDIPAVWRVKMLRVIIPNNKRIIACLERNHELMTKPELKTLQAFRQHTQDLIERHLEGATGGQRYPATMNQMMQDD